MVAVAGCGNKTADENGSLLRPYYNDDTATRYDPMKFSQQFLLTATAAADLMNMFGVFGLMRGFGSSSSKFLFGSDA